MDRSVRSCGKTLGRRPIQGPQRLPGFRAGIANPWRCWEDGQEICHRGKSWDLGLAKVKKLGARAQF